MTIIIHGEDTATSRKAFIDLRNNITNPVILEGGPLTLQQVKQAVDGGGLFGDDVHIFIEELLSKRKTSKELTEIISFLSQTKTPLYLWESKDLTTKQLTPFKNATVRQYKIPTTVFAFLDSIKPNNAKQMIKLFHTTLETQEAGFIYFMLVKHMRLLLALSDVTSTNTIEETKRLSPWQRTKFQKQANNFSSDHLKGLYLTLYTIDLELKTGKQTLSLIQSIDFFLSTI